MKQRFGVDKGKAYYNLMWDLHRIQNKNAAENTETIYATVDRADQAPGTWWDLRGTFSMCHFGPSYWRVRCHRKPRDELEYGFRRLAWFRGCRGQN